MKTNINFDRYETAQVTITSKSEPYEAGSGNKHGKTLMKVRVIYNEEEQRGLALCALKNIKTIKI